MLIINNEQALIYHPVIRYIPHRLRRYLMTVPLDEVEEIRLRCGLELMVCINSECMYVNEKGMLCKERKNGLVVTAKDIDDAMELICESSLYAVEESLKNGYITVGNGCRIGICGSGVVMDSKVTTIRNISGLNYRLAREIKGAADDIIGSIAFGDKILNTLIISPPGAGKTTVLRDIARQLSDRRYKVAVADERNEIGAVHNGYFGYDLGGCCDVLEGVPKEESIMMLIRTMSPHVIITDEIGTYKDAEVIKRAFRSGVSVIASIHGNNKRDIKLYLPELYSAFECFITLKRKNGITTVEEICCDI